MKFIHLKKNFFVFPILIGLISIDANADAGAQARRLYSSLTGVNPSAQEVDLITKKLAAGKATEAAKDIIDSKNGIDSKGTFYNVTVKNFATPWSNVEYTKMFPLNDLTATVIGWVRDEKQFNQILYSDSIYTANGIKMAGSVVSTALTNGAQLIYSGNITSCEGVPTCTFCKDPVVKVGRILFNDPMVANSTTKLCRFTSLTNQQFKDAVGVDAYYIPHLDIKLTTSVIKSTNQMYADMDALNLNLADPRLLVEKSQAVRLHQDPLAISGIMTSRAWGMANYTAGTNRRSFQSTMKHLFCKNMIDINDTNTPDFRVHRDVDRSPGGTSTTYKTLCVGCHAVMDSHVGAYAYYDFPDGAITYTQGKVVKKMNHNAIFTEGFISQDDSWMNLSNQGQNASFGWGPIDSGSGLKALAQMYSETKEFNRCMAKTVFKTVCFKDATTSAENTLVNSLSKSFEDDNFNMKNLFIKTSVACMGK